MTTTDVDCATVTNAAALRWPACLLGISAHEPLAAQPGLPPLDWAQIVTIAQTHQLAPLLYWRLRTAPPPVQPPPNVMKQLHALYITATINALLRERELRITLAALHQAGIQPTLYKGAALAHTVYPTPVCRPMGDLDLWVTATAMPTAQSVIEALGYVQKFKSKRPIAMEQNHDGELQLAGQKVGQSLIELHWGVFSGEWLQYVAAIDRNGTYERRVSTEVLGAPVYLLANEDAVIQLAVHLGINHQLSLHPLRSLVDIALLDQQGVDWPVVVERARAWHLATVVGAVLELLVNIFGATSLTPGLVAAAAALRHSSTRRLITGRWVNTAVVFEQRQIRASRSRFLFLLAMTDRPRSVFELLTHTLWPANTWLAMRYGQVNWSIRLRHLTSALAGDI